MTTVFVSGHLDLTAEEFALYYVARLHAYIQAGCSFVVGDAAGCDHFVAEFFDASFPLGGAPLTVYHMLERPRYHGFPTAEVYRTVGGFTSDEQRDAAMTAASQVDLAWIRPGRERSGTARNIVRRQRIGVP